MNVLFIYLFIYPKTLQMSVDTKYLYSGTQGGLVKKKKDLEVLKNEKKLI